MKAYRLNRHMLLSLHHLDGEFFSYFPESLLNPWEQLNQNRAELLTLLFMYLLHCSFMGPGIFIGALRGQSIVDISYGYDSRTEGDILP